MFKMNILARPLHKARIYAGSDACKCTIFCSIVTQFVHCYILLQNRRLNPHRLCVRDVVPPSLQLTEYEFLLLISVRDYVPKFDTIFGRSSHILRPFFVSIFVLYTALTFAAKSHTFAALFCPFNLRLETPYSPTLGVSIPVRNFKKNLISSHTLIGF